MKKYSQGLCAIICAIVFSAFTKPNSLVNYTLTSDPAAADVVKNPANWSTGGLFYSPSCGSASDKIACTIKLNSTQSTYYHEDGSDDILNTFNYANSQPTKQDYLVITETTSTGQGGNDRIITSITPYRWDPDANGSGQGAYIATSLGSNLSFFNGFEAP